MFFGCRQRDQDFYWQTEWQELEKKGCLSLVTAFSREQVSRLTVDGAGVWTAETQPLTPACRSRRSMCSTGSESWGLLSGSCWIAGVPTST